MAAKIATLGTINIVAVVLGRTTTRLDKEVKQDLEYIHTRQIINADTNILTHIHTNALHFINFTHLPK